MVITMRVAEADMHRILIDGGCSADILFTSAFDQMQIPRSRLTRAKRAPERLQWGLGRGPRPDRVPGLLRPPQQQ
ncbi:hypothetical protein E2562_014316 [Oryza meyeriana var. granulata]|uniref:Uncharacterized protein n=1 Tax=Oryza meyeriana var. granulata TaxID=110450 RepID=A0A6G1C6T1_9ORYZ|nr:hypothetical protein E2562_014316 [Oryza meyeriana var. granulata]